MSSNMRIFECLGEQMDEERAVVVDMTAQKVGIDIAFVLDVTGSMEPYWKQVKTEVANIIKSVRPAVLDQNEGIRLLIRYAFVCYRDITDAKQLVVSDFAPEVKESMSAEDQDKHVREHGLPFLAGIAADGGEDECEDVASALLATSSLAWREKSGHFAVLITDSPGHGEWNGGGRPDDHADSGSGDKGVAEVVRKLLAKKINLIVAPTHSEPVAPMVEAMKARWAEESKEDEKLESIALWGDRPSDRQSLHFVFVLDESGSMSGHPWQKLKEAYNNFVAVRRRAHQGHCTDVYSVVTFASSARTHFTHAPVSEPTRDIEQVSGGTRFLPAMDKAKAVLDMPLAGDYKPIVIFMSDGCAGDSAAAAAVVEELNTKLGGLTFHSVAFGSASKDNLETLKNKASDGHFHAAGDGAALAKTFQDIAMESTKKEAIVTQITGDLAGAISTKISDACF